MATESFHLNTDKSHRFWQLVLLLPNAQNRIIAEFRNRRDAEDHLRSIRRLAPHSNFDIIFVTPPEQNHNPAWD
jgi:hypothetical protein